MARAAGEHVRITAVLVGSQADFLHHRPGGDLTFGAVAATVDGERLLKDRADGLARVKRSVRILEHHLNAEALAPAAGRVVGGVAVEQQGAFAWRLEQRRHAG